MTAPWLVAWAVARTRNKSTPVSSHGNVGPVHWEWLRWAQWKLAGADKRKRPAGVRARIPRSWYPPCERFLAEMRRSPDDLRSSVERFAANIAFCGGDPLSTLASPPRFKVALCADPHPAYDGWMTPETVAELRSHGRSVLSWVGSVSDPWDAKNPKPRAYLAREAANRFSLDGWVGQAESSAAFDDAMAEGARIIVGNANSWTDDQRTRARGQIVSGVLALVQEAYTNVQGPWPDGTGTQGVPVASFCLGTYDGSTDNPNGGRSIPLSEYREHTAPTAWPHVGVYTAEDVQDWEVVR